MKIRLSDHFSYKRLMAFTLPSIAMMILSSVGLMLGTGGTALVALKFGEDEKKLAIKVQNFVRGEPQ